jgi:Tfp pilus assembly protein PilN
MIRVNLLNSVTDRAKGVAAVEEKVANPRSQTLILALSVVALLVLGLAYDYTSANGAKAEAETELQRQREIKNQMMLVNNEQKELEKKTKEVQARIDAIQKLRAEQQGPGNVLREIKDRIDSIPGLYLESVEQKGDELTIKGGSPNENSVTKFGQSLEFASGLFANLTIETERKKVEFAPVSAQSQPGMPARVTDTSAEKPEIVGFTVKCKYSAPKKTEETQSPNASPAANQIAQK